MTKKKKHEQSHFFTSVDLLGLPMNEEEAQHD